MPGPTPISALIHAATMVAAGVFLVARTYPLYLSAPAVLTTLALVAAVTMFISALYALFADDLKRVLAWSTVSQLAYSFGALSVGAYAAGVMHLLAHGAFKALLFLAAGSVVHAVGTTSMSAMGGLRDKLPDTFITMTIGFGALAGVVPLAGFFSKDAIIGAVWEEARHGTLIWPWVAWVLLVSVVATAALTVAYSMRAWLRVFFAPPAPAEASALADAGAAELEEAPPSMKVPLYLLSIPTVLGGLLVAYPYVLFGTGDYQLFHTGVSLFMTLLVLATALLVVWLWRRSGGRDPWHPYVLPHPPVDRVYAFGVVRPVLWLAQVVRLGDRDVIDAYADSAGATARSFGWLLRRAQTGRIQTYLMVVVVGACAIAVAAGVVA